MKSAILLLAVFLPCLQGEVHSLTLKDAVTLSLKQNPEILAARIEQQKTEFAIRVAKDPFVPKIFAGSGLAYSTGYPMSIDGSAPAIIQAKTVMSLYNPAQRFLIAQAKENARTMAIDEATKREDTSYRVAALFLDVLRLGQDRDVARRQIDSFGKVAETVRLRVEEGKQLEIDSEIANFHTARAKQRLEALESDTDYGEASLALVLGFGPNDRVRPVDGDRPAGADPETEEAAVESALANSGEVQKLVSQMQAKGFELRSYKSARLPTFDLVAQYSLLAQHNYEDFFRRFQRNNGQLGISIQIPVLTGSAAGGQAFRAEAEIAQMRLQVQSTRDRVAVDARKGFRDVKRAQSAREIAKMDLDLTRKQISIALSQMEEGRASLRQVEDLRVAEIEKWTAFYDAQNVLEKTKLALLRQTGSILAALQ
ncbi:MAG: TolC family protein [Bryobacteraceae bacterium]